MTRDIQGLPKSRPPGGRRDVPVRPVHEHARLIACVSVIVAGIFLSPGRLSAQIAVADTVRLRALAGQRISGVVAAGDGQSLTVQPTAGDGVRVRLDSLRSAEVLRGRRARGWRAVRWGAAIGTGAGLVLAPLVKASDDRANAKNEGQGFDPLPSSLAFYEFATASVGAVLGTIVGAVVAPTRVHRWIPVRPVAVTRVEPGP